MKRNSFAIQCKVFVFALTRFTLGVDQKPSDSSSYQKYTTLQDAFIDQILHPKSHLTLTNSPLLNSPINRQNTFDKILLKLLPKTKEHKGHEAYYTTGYNDQSPPTLLDKLFLDFLTANPVTLLSLGGVSNDTLSLY